ncbi:MAG: hypothetical protein ACJAVK_001765 [Akkermansiaceae bacterium]|jgi:hypothetical protein
MKILLTLLLTQVRPFGLRQGLQRPFTSVDQKPGDELEELITGFREK